jgi:hypothetical protein
MFHPHSLRRGAVAIVLFSALSLAQAVPCAAEPSGPYRQEVAVAQHAGLFARLWHMLTSVWGGEGTVTDPTGHH